MEIVKRVDNIKGMQREYQLVHLMLTPLEIDTALSQIPDIPTDLVQWSSSGIIGF